MCSSRHEQVPEHGTTRHNLVFEQHDECTQTVPPTIAEVELVAGVISELVIKSSHGPPGACLQPSTRQCSSLMQLVCPFFRRR